MDMADSIVARHTQINAGTIPSSAEELAQKHQNLFQEYSRLKAQYTVLKKAVRKEKSDNALLQSSVKEKEKELRKLQGQLDVMAFHNERLSKRIEAVQKEETKGSHFSLLGGTIKKELEKSTQALDAANMDLSKKIKENEELHDEISDINVIYTKNLNNLYQQIAKLEKRIEELQDERTLLQTETQSQSSSLTKEKSELEDEISHLKEELTQTNRILNETKQNEKGDNQMELEIEHLRAIVLSKIGDLETENNKISLGQVIPAYEALNNLNQQAKNYIYKLRDDSTIPQLPQELANKLKLSSETWTEETNKLAIEIESCQNQIQSLLEEKTNSDTILQNQIQKSTELELTITQLRQQLETPSTDENELSTLKSKISELEQQLSTLEITNNDLKLVNETLKKDSDNSLRELEVKIESILEQLDHKEKLLKQMETDQSTLKNQVEEKSNQINILQNQIESYQQQIFDLEKSQHINNNNNNNNNNSNNNQHNNNNEEEEEEDDDDDEVFVYPVPKEYVESTNENDQVQQNTQINETNGANSKKNENNKEAKHPDTTKPQNLQNGSDDRENDRQNNLKIEEIIRERENKMKNYYESQLSLLTEKLQISDSKASRYSGMVTTLKEKMANQEEEKRSLQNEIQNLKNEVIKAKESLATTESKYQEQLDVLTEYTTSLQMQVARESTN